MNSELTKLIQEVERAGHPPSAQMLSMASLKLDYADFCWKSLPAVHRGDVDDRAHTEACIYFTKTALDCASEAVNLRFDLELVKPPYATSTETLTRNLKTIREALSHVGKVRLAEVIESVLAADWYQELKWLRDRTTHHGVVNELFALGGSDSGSAYLKRIDGSSRPLSVNDDLRQFIKEAMNAILLWTKEMT